MKRRIQKSDIVSFYDSLFSWQVIGFQDVYTVDKRERMVKIKRIIPKPQVEGLAHYKDLVVR